MAARKRKGKASDGMTRAEWAAADAERNEGPYQKISVVLPPALVRELRVAVTELPQRVTGGGPSGLIRQALEAELERLRREHNRGQPFESDEEPRVRKGPAPRP